jgi:EPS-associated MarR family transcriptional regulator
MNAPFQHNALTSPSDPDIAVTLSVLRLLEAQPQLSQRELSRALGLSLGKTHYLVRALLNKGLLKIENFKRSDKKLAYAYLLTPKGFSEKLTLARSFLARKEAEFEQLRVTIAALRREVAHQTLSSRHDRPSNRP